MIRKINPNLIELAKKTYNPNLEMPSLEEKATQTPTQEFIGIANPQDYLILEGRSHGSYSYPDLLVCKYKLDANPEAIKAGRQLGLQLKNTAKEQNGRNYTGNINWEQAINLNLLLSGRTLDLRQAADLFSLLKSGKAFDVKGNKVDSKELERILDEIIAPREPWRNEWFEDKYKNGKLEKTYKLANGILVPDYSQALESCLMENKHPGIDFDKWLRKANSQGLPPENIKLGGLYYWNPTNNHIARFGADSVRACLDCSGGPGYSGPSLGVRHVRTAPKNF